MAKKPTWCPDMIPAPKPVKAKKVEPLAAPKRGRPKKTEGSSAQSMVYLDSDFYLVRSADGYQEALKDWWGDDTPFSTAKAPDEFPAIVCFSDSSEPGSKIRCSWAPRANLGFTATMVRDVEPQIVERVVEKVVEVATPPVTVEKVVEVATPPVTVEKIVEVPVDRVVEKIVDRVVEVERDLTFFDVFSFIIDQIVGLTRIVFDR